MPNDDDHPEMKATTIKIPWEMYVAIRDERRKREDAGEDPHRCSMNAVINDALAMFMSEG